MFWIGLAIMVIGGLISIPFIRAWIQVIIHQEIDQLLFDISRVVLIISGAVIASTSHVQRQYEVSILQDYGYVSMLNRVGSRGPVREQALDIGGFYIGFQGVFSVDNNKLRLFSCDV